MKRTIAVVIPDDEEADRQRWLRREKRLLKEQLRDGDELDQLEAAARLADMEADNERV